MGEKDNPFKEEQNRYTDGTSMLYICGSIHSQKLWNYSCGGRTLSNYIGENEKRICVSKRIKRFIKVLWL
jgi:hypothetical protein